MSPKIRAKLTISFISVARLDQVAQFSQIRHEDPGSDLFSICEEKSLVISVS